MYVLITPARNEANNIERVIKSMIAQTRLPAKWVIVSDGSTDGTDEIVQGYLAAYPWIDLIRMPEHVNRDFAAKVNCFNAGYQRVKEIPYDIIGNLDADLSFEPDYLGYLLGQFEADASLGCAGTPFVEAGVHYDYRFTNIAHVSGACQLFRRRCFEEIGGYVPIKGGGIDWVAVTTARMKGWRTQTFVDKTCLHHRKIGSGNARAAWTWFRQGRKDYFLGNHFLWELFRFSYQMTRKPRLVRGCLLLCGYLWALLLKTEKPISDELQRFVHAEQMLRLKRKLGRN